MAEQRDEAAGWIQHLRDFDEDDFAVDDPMVFGKPRPKPQPKQKRRSSSSSRVDMSTSASGSGPSSEAATSEETRSWIAGLRGTALDEEEETGDPLVFAKPRSEPLLRVRPSRRPPRPAPDPLPPEPSAPSSSAGFGGSRRPHSGGARPSSGGSLGLGSGCVVGQQMPEALRKRLDRRSEQRSRDRRSEKQGRQGQHGSPRKEGSRGESQEDGRACRLPPLDPDGGRRCSSVPPVDQPIVVGQQKPSRKVRPQSLGAVAHADDDEKCTRQMFDKNTLRTQHRDLFMLAIQLYRQERCQGGIAEEVADDESRSQGIKVFVRKRPLFEKEAHVRCDYDVVTTLPGAPPTRAVVHSCLFQADLKTPFVHNLTFNFDRVFDEKASNEDVYREAAQNLVHNCLDGGIGTMFMFGQTGSGKTHTMGAIQALAAQELFQGADGAEPWISVQFVELRGNRCFDLLAPSMREGRRDVRPELRLREQGDGTYCADGAVDLMPTTPEELCAVMEMAQSRRATSATDANAVSSRSHAVCTLRLLQNDGQLLLVDCAGTERRKDSMYHSKERQQEGAEINASLHALKECIRYLTTQQRVPSHAYRASSLTKVLAESFMRAGAAQLAVVCTASPCATDTEHTIATLRMGMALAGRGAELEEKQMVRDLEPKRPRLVHPKQWTPEQVFEWMVGLCDGLFIEVAEGLPSNFTGQMLVRVTEGRCVQLCGGHERRGRQLFDLLHQEIQRVELSRKQG